jgi:hypothetical protein
MIEELRLSPESSTLKAGETATLRVTGFAGGEDVGDLSRRPDLVWKSRSPEIVSVNGPSVSAIAAGRGAVTVQLNDRISNLATVNVIDSGDADAIAAPGFQPSQLTLRVGERVDLDRKVALRRGTTPLQVTQWTIDDSSVGRLEDAELIGTGTGTAKLTATAGGESYRLPIRVMPPRRTRLTAPRDRIASTGRGRTGIAASPIADAVTGRAAAAVGRGRGRGRGHRVAKWVPETPGVAWTADSAEGVSTASVYDFAGHTARDVTPRLVVVPSGGSVPVGGLRSVQVFAVDTSGNRVERTADARLQSSDPAILRVSGNRVAGISAGTARLMVSDEASGRSTSASFQVVAAPAQRVEVTPAQVVVDVDQRQALQVRTPAAVLADRRRMTFRILGDQDVATVDESGTVTGKRPGRTAVGVTWEGQPEISVPVSVRRRDIFSAVVSQTDRTAGAAAEAAATDERSPDSAAAVNRHGSLGIEIANVRDEQQFSTAEIHVLVPDDWEPVEFRVAEPTATGSWIAPSERNGRKVAVLESPPLTRRTGKLHRVKLESRRVGDDRVESYALRFQLQSRASKQAMDSSN